jgi:xanthine dehydrogenase YagS FAD-binding subunit
MATLEEMHDHPATLDYAALWQAIHGIASLQFQSQGTLGGELCQRPRCWYFRDGQGLLADHGRRVAEGDNRFHAIFGNAGPAKFVSPSRLAPALIAHSASVRVIGPEHGDEAMMPIEDLFRTPKREHESEHVLEPNQVVAQVFLPPADGRLSANYEVHHGSGQDYPLVSAAASIIVEQGVVRDARVVLGQVAPTPWISHEAAAAIVGLPINDETATIAGDAAISVATPLASNEYKVQLARVAVKRALLAAAGLETGGL